MLLEIFTLMFWVLVILSYIVLFKTTMLYFDEDGQLVFSATITEFIIFILYVISFLVVLGIAGYMLFGMVWGFVGGIL